MVSRMILLCSMLAGCSVHPHVDWPPGIIGETPALFPLSYLHPEDRTTIEARGADLAARAASLRSLAISIGTQ